MPLRRGPIHSDFYVLPMEERVQVQMQGRAAAPKNEVADASRASCTSLPPRPKWLSYPKMYRNSNRKAASQRTKGRLARGDPAIVDTPVSCAVADLTPKTSLSHFVLHSSSTPKTSQSSPSIPSSIQCCHSVEELHLNQPIDDAIPAVIVESSNGADEEAVEDLEHEHDSVATPKARRAEPLKAIRNAFSRKKREDGFESDTESRQQRRPSVGSSASGKSNKSAGSWGWRDSSKKGRMQRLFLFNKPGSKRNVFKDAPDTDQMEYASDHHMAIPPVKRSVCPQDYLDAMIYARGYSTLRHDTLSSAYFNRPTPLQEASYHTHMIDLVRSGNARALRLHLGCGLSPNPSNTYGESLVHKVCRVGRSRLLQVMLDCGVDVRVADENGRTPMHEACAANSLECFEIICEEDLRMLFMADRQRQLPLQYVPKNAWMDWIQFLEARKEEFWPESRFGRRSNMEEPPPLFTLQPPNSRPVKDPPNALTFGIAAMVASGQLGPEHAQDAMRDKQEESNRARATVEDVSASTNSALNYLPVPRQLVHTMDVSDLHSELTLSVAGDLAVGSPDPKTVEAIGVKTRTIGRGKKCMSDDEDDELTVEDNGTHDLDTQTNDREDLSTIEDLDMQHYLDDPSLNLQGTEAAMGVLGITPRFSPSFSL